MFSLDHSIQGYRLASFFNSTKNDGLAYLLLSTSK